MQLYAVINAQSGVVKSQVGSRVDTAADTPPLIGSRVDTGVDASPLMGTRVGTAAHPLSLIGSATDEVTACSQCHKGLQADVLHCTVVEMRHCPSAKSHPDPLLAANGVWMPQAVMHTDCMFRVHNIFKVYLINYVHPCWLHLDKLQALMTHAMLHQLPRA